MTKHVKIGGAEYKLIEVDETLKPRKLMTRTQAAKYIGLDRRTLEAWEREGHGPVVVRLPNGLPKYLVSDLDSFIDSHRQTNHR